MTFLSIPSEEKRTAPSVLSTVMSIISLNSWSRVIAISKDTNRKGSAFPTERENDQHEKSSSDVSRLVGAYLKIRPLLKMDKKDKATYELPEKKNATKKEALFF